MRPRVTSRTRSNPPRRTPGCVQRHGILVGARMLDRARSEGRLIGLLQSGRAGEPVVCQPGAGEVAEAMTIELIDLPMLAEVEIDDARRQRDLAAESMLEVAHSALEHAGLFDSVHRPRRVAGRPWNPRFHDEIDCAADGRLEVAD